MQGLGVGCRHDEGDRGLVGRKSLMLGTGPINVSMSVTQLNCAGW